MEPTAILQPVIALGLWTGVMWIWMYATRIPAMNKAGIDPQDAAHVTDMSLPSEISRIADNYNHLFEQPTLFYAIAIAIAVLGHGDATAVTCAWTFVILRVIHSLIQSTVNVVILRFSVFMLSWVALLVMTVREALVIF
ncbi:MAG TPA: hypothetical protein DIT66_07265 [Rhodobiaceae bacterium]|nr:MAG: Uncharacterised protein [Rhodobiaceae bacterium UBA7378]HCQ82609.1 hypothetical protein [Rhodobiaceae bacterium]|tara:strand:- start:1943 stop:2359 length:417 start_codon:yes stop_codon:yes gene_type:complete